MLLFSIPVLLISCTNTDKENVDKTDPDNIYFDYKVTAAEGNDNLTVLLQYRAGGEEGDGVSITEPGKIMLDGEILPPDSTKMSGTFYELHKPIAEFAGKHSIVYTDLIKRSTKKNSVFNPLF